MEQQGVESAQPTAQELHAAGHFAEAQEAWNTPPTDATTLYRQGIELRGLAATEDRLGLPSLAAEAAERAYDYHDRNLSAAVTRGTASERTEALRERAQSATVLGQIMMRQAVEGERSGTMSRWNVLATGDAALTFLRGSLHDLEQAEDDRPDQYRVNNVSRRAVAETLYGTEHNSPRDARRYGRQALRLGFLSEGKHVANTANISLGYTVKAKGRGILRGVGAFVASHMAALPIPHKRRGVLAIAANRFFGL